MSLDDIFVLKSALEYFSYMLIPKILFVYTHRFMIKEPKMQMNVIKSFAYALASTRCIYVPAQIMDRFSVYAYYNMAHYMDLVMCKKSRFIYLGQVTTMIFYPHCAVLNAYRNCGQDFHIQLSYDIVFQSMQNSGKRATATCYS